MFLIDDDDDDDDAVGEDEDTRSEDSEDSESESESSVIQQISGPNDLSDDTPDGAEIEIEGDFECVSPKTFKNLIVTTYYSRLIANIRVSDGASGSNVMTRDWDFNIEENEAEFRDDLRAASGIGRKRRKVHQCSVHSSQHIPK
jgi:general transcription factor 3C polypeptide 3 (transcription factor C subunit 4)